MPGKEEWVLVKLGSQRNCVERPVRPVFPDYLFLMTMVKVSSTYMENVHQIIKNHSNYVSRKKPKPTPSCNCKKKDDCPLNGNCLTNNVRYKCTVSPTATTKKPAYLGLTEGEWKQ